MTPDQYYCVSGKVNSADKLYLVMESVKVDTKHPGLPRFLLLLTAREGDLLADDSPQGKRSRLADCLFIPIRRRVPRCVREVAATKLAPSKPPRVAPF